MPSTAALDAFVAQVIAGDHVGAIRDWYAEDAWMRENLGEPRVGRETLMAHEAAVLARVDRVESALLEPPLVDGDRVALHWRFTFHLPGGATRSMEEIAWQTWRGDRIAEETFFYDPGQMR